MDMKLQEKDLSKIDGGFTKEQFLHYKQLLKEGKNEEAIEYFERCAGEIVFKPQHSKNNLRKN